MYENRPNNLKRNLTILISCYTEKMSTNDFKNIFRENVCILCFLCDKSTKSNHLQQSNTTMTTTTTTTNNNNNNKDE